VRGCQQEHSHQGCQRSYATFCGHRGFNRGHKNSLEQKA